MLGPFRRLENRIGRSITQDEAAEACGISRQWYGGLEQGAPIRMSMSALTRIADVLMLDGARRRELFTLSFPELTFLPEIDNAVKIDERLPAARAIADRLGSATSELEALAIIADALAVFLRLVEDRMTIPFVSSDRKSAVENYGIRNRALHIQRIETG